MLWALSERLEPGDEGTNWLVDRVMSKRRKINKIKGAYGEASNLRRPTDAAKGRETKPRERCRRAVELGA